MSQQQGSGSGFISGLDNQDTSAQVAYRCMECNTSVKLAKGDAIPALGRQEHNERIVMVFSIYLHITFNMASVNMNNPVAGGQNLPDSTQIETTWSMGFASLTSNKYHCGRHLVREFTN
ncbi:uncharacterized protein AB675_5426 [Cyphellophora attinorum]|uniref:Uncharacterized protein n=1 Tax=Cyphellophora attinorum TaxID=1664694 RepID=A0A0N1H726_9EURO|nr:uncharacterized protein AB675_5426 [Phialophora attinorum]KPI42077.1 hypothetical protein AB675_5426 [Phialophora attinorum]